MEKRKWTMVLAILIGGAVLFGSGVTVGAATTEPGSIGDPLITKSYLEQELSTWAASGYECVTLSQGNTLSLKQGAQILLYTGSAKVAGSLIDMSGGELCTAGSTAARYHLYLAPADGSGFTATTPCVIFVMGQRQ